MLTYLILISLFSLIACIALWLSDDASPLLGCPGVPRYKRLAFALGVVVFAFPLTLALGATLAYRGLRFLARKSRAWLVAR